MKLLLLLLFLSSCSMFMSGKESPKTAKETRYKVTFDKPDWKYKKDKRSDYVFENLNDGRILLSNSFCEEFQEESLESLARKTFKSVKSFKVHKNHYSTFNDREAYRISGSGLVDGVKVTLRLLNTRRNNCYFDFLSISPEGTEKDETIFNEFLKSVEFQ
jgi:hypothetical protein